MGTMADDIIKVLLDSFGSSPIELQNKLGLKDVPIVQILGNKIIYTMPKAQKLDGLLNQPNYIRVPETERKMQNGTSVRVQSYKRQTIKPTVTQAVKAYEVDKADTDKVADALLEVISHRIQIGLGNLKSVSL